MNRDLIPDTVIIPGEKRLGLVTKEDFAKFAKEETERICKEFEKIAEKEVEKKVQEIIARRETQEQSP